MLDKPRDWKGTTTTTIAKLSLGFMSDHTSSGQILSDARAVLLDTAPKPEGPRLE